MVPTIGILQGLGENEDGKRESGKIIVMTDSDCLDSVHYKSQADQDPLLISQKCFWLIHKFADIATGKLTKDSLMDEKFKLPQDFASQHEVRTETLEQYRQSKAPIDEESVEGTQF